MFGQNLFRDVVAFSLMSPVVHRDIASAIKELLDTVNNVIKKYQYQNRRVSNGHTTVL